MRRLILPLAGLLMTVMLAHSGAQAHDYRLGDLEIKHPWSRATPRGAAVGGGYLTIVNRGSAADRLVSATSAVSGGVELHEMAIRDGVMTMRPLAGGIPIPPGATVKLAPGGLHLMFTGLKGELKQGEAFKALLIFEKAGSIEVEFMVQAVGAREAPSHDPDRHGGHGR